MSNNDEEECEEILDKDGDGTGTTADRSPIIGHIPCLAHVFQLAVGELYRKLLIKAKNNDFVKI